MGAPHRMFRVIVLGGVALVDCGARTDIGGPHLEDDASKPMTDAADEDVGLSFPQETAFAFDAASSDATVVSDVWFPGEANAPLPDSGTK